MKLCGWCEKIIWPWQRYGFRKLATGEARWHVACGAKVDRIFAETQEQYRQKQARLRWEQEDRL